MCTSIAMAWGGGYFGRNMDVEYTFGEQAVILPRRCPLRFWRQPAQAEHYALIGMALVAEGYPLYYDAVNEKGLSMAGLNFPVSAVYQPERTGRDNIAPFEFIPWLLGQCADLAEARRLLARVHLADIAFSEKLPPHPAQRVDDARRQKEANRHSVRQSEVVDGRARTERRFVGRLDAFLRRH